MDSIFKGPRYYLENAGIFFCKTEDPEGGIGWLNSPFSMIDGHKGRLGVMDAG